MATVFIDGTEEALNSAQKVDVGGTQGPVAAAGNASGHSSTSASGEFIGANFNYIKIETADISGSRGVDANGVLEALPTIVNLVALRATIVVVNNGTTVTSIITEGPLGWTAADLQLAIQHSDYETGGTTNRTVDGINLGTATVDIADALTLA